MSNSGKVVENKWIKYLDSPKKEQSSDTEKSSSGDICEAGNIMSGEKSPCNDRNSDSVNFDGIIDDTDSDFEIEDVAEDRETKDLCSISSNKNINIVQDINLPDNNKTSKNHNDVTSIFETYDELDDPLDF